MTSIKRSKGMVVKVVYLQYTYEYTIIQRNSSDMKKINNSMN